MSTAQPYLIKDGRPTPISAEQYAAARAYRPMPPAAARRPVAAPAAASAKPAFPAPTFDSRAFSRADMRRQVASMTRETVETASTGAEMSRESMRAELRRQGLEPVR